MPSIDPDFMVHRLNMNEDVRPVKQKKRNFSAEKNTAIKVEVDKLLAADFIEPCDYPEWLANVVMVKKSNGTWRMCVDFTDLNKACPKDCYPLPRIDQLVDSTSGHALLSFMDAFSGYHQISLLESDRNKAAFITDAGVYAYKAMPFGLKNAGATYQKLVDKIFEHQKGRNVEVYVDDSIVKSLTEEDHIVDLEETFETVRQHQMKLNPKKCVFGVRSGKFLGFMVSERGIDANSDKIKAISDLPEPKSIRNIQKLTGRMAALTRFVSKLAEKALPFFKILRGNKKFEWGEEQKQAFEKVKEHFQRLPTITRPELGEKLQLYVSVTEKTVAAVLLVNRQGQQSPIYFVSHVLAGAEQRYELLEKMAYAVLIAARKLRPYFDSHTVQVLTNQPLEKALHKLDTTGRLLKWAIELSEFDIEYRPRTAIKAQALADFIVETIYSEPAESTGRWKIEVDGSATQSGAGAGVVMTSPEGEIFEHAIRFGFKASNNEAEYEAALAGLSLSIAAGARNVIMITDSQLISSQIKGTYEAREPVMQKYLHLVKNMVKGLQSFEVQLVPRAENMAADALPKLASSSLSDKKRNVRVETLVERSIEVVPASFNTITTEPEWYEGILAYKLKGELPEDKMTAQKLRRDSVWYCSFQRQLYKKGFSLPLLSCVTANEATKIIEEIHEGICGNHIGGKALALKALRAGFYWPTMLTDAQTYVKKCDKCQRFAPVINQPANDLQPILNPIPFAQWRMDIIGPFTPAFGGRKFLIVGIDYFTKWIEAEPTAKITANQKRLDELKGAWADRVPAVLWSNRTTEKEATGETPFRLAFGAEAVLPVEVGLPNWRILNYEPVLNEQIHKKDLDLLQEVRVAAELRSAAYKDRISKAYNKRVRSRPISKGDLVLRRTAATGKAHVDGKLTANWEGPYLVKEEIVPGSYQLEDMAGKLLKNSWNASVLKKATLCQNFSSFRVVTKPQRSQTFDKNSRQIVMGSDMEKLDALLQRLEKNEARSDNYAKHILQLHGEIEKLSWRRENAKAGVN
ncbi:uncharacterized protein LOC104883586 [Beta vulgaris subsp. vulgaris]|uniref:uncharacterized protein LOC104883586 n=1 Tax=Beta vulgaris subsp. vulgaris TaxID=3555 RepID=UPI00254895B4|nr:uncharacterized protein LOC104883586 [Beta vulgaris subsp. vulgaris]